MSNLLTAVLWALGAEVVLAGSVIYVYLTMRYLAQESWKGLVMAAILVFLAFVALFYFVGPPV